MLKYVILNCQNIDDVNDILQETYTQLFRIMQKQEIIDARPFIFGIAKNKLKRHHSYTSKLKKIFVNKNINDDEFIDLISSNYNLEDHLLNKLTEEEIWSYLEKKKPLITKIFYLYYTEDITIKEIINSIVYKYEPKGEWKNKPGYGVDEDSTGVYSISINEIVKIKDGANLHKSIIDVEKNLGIKFLKNNKIQYSYFDVYTIDSIRNQTYRG